MPPLRLACLALLGCWFLAGLHAPPAIAAIPAAARADPRFRLGYLVATHYSGVRSNGTGDSTAGLQEAIDDGFSNALVVWLPHGTYLISDTLHCLQWRELKADGVSLEANLFKEKPCALVGEHRSDGARPRLLLKPTAATAPLFSDPARPRPLLMLRNLQATTAPAKPKNLPADILDAPAGWSIDTSYVFNAEVRNLEFDCGGQRGAIGVVWPAAQGSQVERVKVTATGAHAGFYGLPGRNWGAIDIEVVGGEYGIRCGYGAGQATRDPVAGVTIVGARLTHQTRRAIDYADFAPLLLIGFAIVKDYSLDGSTAQAPILINEYAFATANNTMTLLDGSVELLNGAGAPAIDNPGNGTTAGKTCYLRNLHVRGTTQLVRSTGGSGLKVPEATRWNRIDSYAYNDPRGREGPFPAGTIHRQFATRSLLDGALGMANEPVALSTPDSGEPPADLLARHLPAGGFPCYEGEASPPALIPTDASYGVVLGEQVDAAIAERNTTALQRAIDDAANDPAYQGRVFLPKGHYAIAGTLNLRATTRLFGVGKTHLTVLAAHGSWRPKAAPGVLVTTDDDAKAVTFLGGLDLRVPDVNLYEHPFTYYHWRAGARSMTWNINCRCDTWINRPKFDASTTAPYVCTRFDGQAGGRHYFFGHIEQQFSGDVTAAGFRTVVIEGTTQPLRFYGFNIEGGKTDRRETDAEVTGASHVAFLGFKREGGAPMLRLRDCDNVLLCSAGAMRERASERTGNSDVGYIEVSGKAGRLTAVCIQVQQSSDGADGDTLRERLDGHPRLALPYPLGVSLYRRGTLDYAALFPAEADDAHGATREQALANIAVRTQLDAERTSITVGFVIAGAGPRRLLLRAVGPTLARYDVSDSLADPIVELWKDAHLLATNDDWSKWPGLDDAWFARAGAFPLPVGSRDAALLVELDPGRYTVQARAKPGDSGQTLVEAYELGSPTP